MSESNPGIDGLEAAIGVLEAKFNSLDPKISPGGVAAAKIFGGIGVALGGIAAVHEATLDDSFPVGKALFGVAGAVAAGLFFSVPLGTPFVAGLLAAGFVGWLGGTLGEFLYDGLDGLGFFDAMADLWDWAKHVISPLALDLDGDGIDSVSLGRKLINGVSVERDL